MGQQASKGPRASFPTAGDGPFTLLVWKTRLLKKLHVSRSLVSHSIKYSCNKMVMIVLSSNYSVRHPILIQGTYK